MPYVFPVSTPEEQGVPSETLLRFQQWLDHRHVPLHSALFLRHGHLILETYTPPYGPEEPHRMFSITKSFVSLAIGLLADEGKLSLNDCVADYFADMLAGEDIHPYIRQTTVRDLLRMASPHIGSAYKLLSPDHWPDMECVEAFFLCPPSHRPGTLFAYDTSATYVLCALVERLCGMRFLDYLRQKALNDIGFSSVAYCMLDSHNYSMGGSGLMCTPMDLLRVLYLLHMGGKYEGHQLLPQDYVKEATSRQIDNFVKPVHTTWEEMQGYGYQFWCIRDGGFACYGMGGQLAVCLPQKDMLFVVTADTQDIDGGVQLLYDAFFTQVYPYLSEAPLAPSPWELQRLQDYSASRQLPIVPGSVGSPLLNQINNVRYLLDENPMGFRAVTLTLGRGKGALTWEKANGTFRLPLGLGKNLVVPFPESAYRCAASGTFMNENTFVAKAQLVDTCIGSITFELNFDGPYVTLLMHCVEETMFKEYNGFISGHRED